MVASVGLSGCDGGEGPTEAATTQIADGSEGARIEVASIRPSEARIDLQLTGEVEGAADANLASALGGYVESVRVKSGDSVKKGQLLVSIDRQLYGAAYAQAEAQRDLAASELKRLEQLGDGVSASQLSQAQTQLKVADAALRQAGVRLRRASVVAPFAGIVSAVAVSEGEFAGPGTPVVRLVQLSPARVITQVSDRDVVTLKAGLDVSVTASALGSQQEGPIVQVSPVGDGNSRSFQVEVEVANEDASLLPGMVARVAVERSLGDAIVVPQDWVISRRDGHGVFVMVDGVATWRRIELGQVLHNQVVVESGLEEGARVIMVGHRELIEGDPVLVTREGVCCKGGRVQYGDQEG
ncbi:MAG: efflux RND transporter periplasmic adaptor subunit [Myxococcota bacterium]